MFTSELLCAIRELLDVVFGEHAQHDDEIRALFISFLCFFEGFRIDEFPVDLRPLSTRRDAVLRWLGTC